MNSTSNETTTRPLTVLVTGATGKVGRHLVRRLLDDGHTVRALTRRPDSAGLPAEVDLRLGDPTRPDAVADAARGADAAFWNWMGFDATGAAESVSALASEVEHVVYLSAAQLQHGTRGVLPGVWGDVEAAIEATGTDWTFLRAGGFAANTLGWAQAIRAGEPVLMPYPDAVRSSVHEADIAEVALRCLVEPIHRGQAYEITGPQQLTQRQEAEAIGEAVGRPVVVRRQDADEAREQYAAWSGRAFAEATLGYYATLVADPERVSDDVERVTGHPARSFARWADDHREDFAPLGTAQDARH
ncbi:NAD(P)H-binding protein [Streptomyces sp. NPDC006645]|uniref:NAD(P)H-binding protein n=1 Tax=unclassified Streptomyces TaxID=2593676 RepID=UPI0033B0CCA3